MGGDSTGCAKGCGVIATAVVSLFLIAALINAFTGGPDEVRVTGQIEVSDPSACREPKVKIRPEGRSDRTLTFEATSWRAGQTCILPIDVTLPTASRYRVEVPGVGVETLEHREGDKALVVRLSW